MRHVVRYDIAHGSDGVTRRELYAAMGREPAPVVVPEGAAHVWAWYWEVAAQRSERCAPIGWAELAAWQQMTGELIQPWEARAMMRMDAAYREQMAREQQREREREARGRSV